MGTADLDTGGRPDLTGRIDLWHIAVAEAGPALQKCRGVMTSEETERAERFVFEEDRRVHTLARGLVRAALSHYAPVAPEQWRFRTGPHGRPEVATPAEGFPLRFNLSHTRDMVVCAVALEASVGVDVEDAGRRCEADEIAARHYSADEIADLDRLVGWSRTRRFFEYWTLKEAYLKGRGAGLTLPLASARFVLDGAATTATFAPDVDDGRQWFFHRLWLGQTHHVAVAAPADLALRSLPAAPVLGALGAQPRWRAKN